MFATEDRTDVFCLHSIKPFCGILNISGSTPKGRNLATQKVFLKKGAKLPKAHLTSQSTNIWYGISISSADYTSLLKLSCLPMSIAQPSHELTNILVFMRLDVVRSVNWKSLTKMYITPLDWEDSVYFAYLDIFQFLGFYIYVILPQSGKASIRVQ